MDLNVYKKRLGAKTPSQALVNASIRQVKSMFTESPLYKIIQINGVDKGVRLSFKSDNERIILLQPEETISRGDVAEFENNKWLAVETTPDVVYPKAKLNLCNSSLTINGIEYPIVVKNKTSNLDMKEEKYMNVAVGQFVAFATLDSNTRSVELTTVFQMGDNSYEVIGVDDITYVVNGTGLVQFTLERTSKSTGTDPNSDSSGAWGGGW